MKRILPTLCLVLAATLAGAQDVKREISRVTFDVYRFQNQFHVNMFVITGAGVVVTDPINAEAAAWLKDEIANNYPEYTSPPPLDDDRRNETSWTFMKKIIDSREATKSEGGH